MAGKLRIEVFSEKETALLAKILAPELKKKLSRRKSAFVVGLKGILGSGKTTFIRYFAKELGIREKILSPSFLIFKKYPLPLNSKLKTLNSKLYLMHVDCYRLKRAGELLALGFKNELANPKNLIMIEWAEKIKGILPKNMLWISIGISGQSKRVFTLIDHYH